MKSTLFLLSSLLSAQLLAQTIGNDLANNTIAKNYISEQNESEAISKISFIENKGQIHDQYYHPRPDVLYGATAGNMVFHLKTNGVSYQLTRVDSYKEVEDPKTNQTSKEIDHQTIYRIDLNWLNPNSNLRTTTDQAMEGYNNYYLESCPNGALNVKSYKGVTVHNLFDGINLHYYEKAGQLKHDYIVSPGANYKQIQLLVNGATVSVNEDGSLTLKTPLGKIEEGAPIVFQNGKQLKAKWVVIKAESEASRRLSFVIENYNPNQELIIDPVTRAWGTYYSTTGALTEGRSIATDNQGNVYLAGFTSSFVSTTNLATSGAHQTAYGGGVDGDAFLAKFNTFGFRLWGTYYGGNGTDKGYSCSTDATGNVYLAGFTTSAGNIIATVGSHQATSGGNNDAFLVKFDANGVRQWGTCYGGNASDEGNSCTTDAQGNVYLAGITQTVNNFTMYTSGAHQETIGGNFDAFLVKFDANGVRQWGTYYGGNNEDGADGCVTDALGNVYLCGNTYSPTGTGIGTSGSHQVIHGGGYDAFLVKFNTNGVRQWGTYYGGSGSDFAYSCETDAFGNIFIAGSTNTDFGTTIATSGTFQTVYGGGYDAFLVKFNTDGVRQWGTYFGGITGADNGNFCCTDAAGNVFLTGRTSYNTPTVLVTSNGYQTVHGGGDDAFLVKFDSNGQRLASTYYGGVGTDEGYACAVDPIGNTYMAGRTNSSTTLIASSGSHQSAYAGSYAAFLVKFEPCSGPTTTTVNLTECNSYTWSANATTYTSSGTYNATLLSTAGCDSIITLNLTIINLDNTTSLNGATITANANSATYQWVDCNNGNTNIPGATSQSFTPTANGNYAVIVTQNGCSTMSNCVTVAFIGTNEISNLNSVTVYPNPTSGNMQINLGKVYQTTSIKLLNLLGQTISHKTYTLTNEINYEIEGAPGIYLLEVETTAKLFVRLPIVKN